MNELNEYFELNEDNFQRIELRLTVGLEQSHLLFVLHQRPTLNAHV